MNLILVKMFATALALAQVTTQPDTLKTEFHPTNDEAEVVQLLKDGCAHMRKAFDIESLNLDALIETALDDPQTVAGEIKAFRGINFQDLHVAYKLFCSSAPYENSPFDLKLVIEFYNKVAADLPDHAKLKGLKLPGTSVVLDRKGERVAELFESDHRRVWVPLSEIPEFVQQAFIAAEDKRFYQHKGLDERGLIRAFISNLTEPGRPQGGSTITQQVAKNLLVGDDVSYERKIREMIVASRIDQALTKAEILEVYLNSIFLGRGSWGIDMAARSYFKKPASALNLNEGAMLAAMAKGPAYFSPDRFPDRARERYAYVIKRMQEDKVEGADLHVPGTTFGPRIVPYERPRRESGFHFVDHLMREARTLVGMQSLTVESYTVRSTINVKLQRAVEASLQEGLARYELWKHRVKYEGPEMNLGEAVMRARTEQNTRAQRRGRVVMPEWRIALIGARLPLYDVHWSPAVVLERRPGDGGRFQIRVGLKDGRIMPLSIPEGVDSRDIKLNDVIYVKVQENKDAKKRAEVRAELRVRPNVQGAALVLENKTGRILAMAGGFSYPMSQLNRTAQALRQPGSSIKPLIYLAALNRGLQPNTLVQDHSVTLPPIPGVTTHYWSPKNYDRSAAGTMTMRRALENSKNMVTARLLDGGVDKDPTKSLEQICDLALEARIYTECMKNYPFVLGAQSLRMIDLAAFYAAIANEGQRVIPYAIDSIEQNGKAVYRRKPLAPHIMANGDRVAFYQLRTILEGVVTRGTAVEKLKANTIIFNDHRVDEKTDQGTFIHFDEWSKAKPAQYKFLNIFPGFKEGMVHKIIDGSKKEVRDELQMYVTEARFKLARPAASIDLKTYANLPFIQSIDPSIKHSLIQASEVSVLKDEKSANMRNPNRPWCEGAGVTACIRSHYKLEGKLPIGVALANKIRDSERKLSDSIEFESELRLLTAADVDEQGLKQLTGINTPVTGVLEQNMFYVNQVMRFGKLLAVFQPNPADANSSVATVMIALAVGSSTLDMKKKYQAVPVLRNLVPSQVLLGYSSFNTGNSISAGLPNYVRNRIKAIAEILDKG